MLNIAVYFFVGRLVESRESLMMRIGTYYIIIVWRRHMLRLI